METSAQVPYYKLTDAEAPCYKQGPQSFQEETAYIRMGAA